MFLIALIIYILVISSIVFIPYLAIRKGIVFSDNSYVNINKEDGNFKEDNNDVKKLDEILTSKGVKFKRDTLRK